ncbi:hypothetical protein AB1L88_15660 [Tautonia sp. JC769]|uniref:hypothetical protein n=1 Tax=Tautonia sp. JC769 TaxID=3232135 RepID=UPI00345B1FA4
MGWFKKKTAAGKYRLENEQGHALVDEQDNPIEFEDADAEAEARTKAPKVEEVAGELLKAEPDPALAEMQAKLDASQKKIDSLIGMVNKLVEANTTSIKDQAEALTRNLIKANKIVPAQASAIQATYTALAESDAANGTKLAEGYVAQLSGGEGHGWTAEHVAPGRQHKNAAMGGLEALGPSGGTVAKVNLEGGRSVLDPGEGTERVGGNAPTAERMAQLLGMTTTGQAALARIRSGELDVAALKQRVGLTR